MAPKLFFASVLPPKTSLYPVQSSLIGRLLANRRPGPARPSRRHILAFQHSSVEGTLSRRSLMPWHEVIVSIPSDLQPASSCFPFSHVPLPHRVRRWPHISRYRPSRAEAGESQYLHFLGGFLGTRVFIKVRIPSQSSPDSLRLRRHASLKRWKAPSSER